MTSPVIVSAQIDLPGTEDRRTSFLFRPELPTIEPTQHTTVVASTSLGAMRFLAYAADESGPLMENVSKLFRGLFGAFENLITIGQDFEGPWNIIFPLVIFLAIALAFVGGFRYMFETVQKQVMPLLLVGLSVIAVLAIANVVREQDQTASNDDKYTVED